MDSATFKKIFFQWTLRKGSIWIAFIYLIATLLGSAFAICASLGMTEYTEKVSMYILDVCLVTEFLMTILLLIGIFKNYRVLIISWVICVFLCGFVLAVTIYNFFTVLEMENKARVDAMLDLFCAACTDFLGLKLLLSVVVLKYYLATRNRCPESVTIAVPFSELKENDTIMV